MKNKPKAKIGLHKHIALGGSPKAYKGATANAVANKTKKK